MVSTDREWLHRVDSGPSGLMSQRRGSADSGRSLRQRATGQFDPNPVICWRPEGGLQCDNQTVLGNARCQETSLANPRPQPFLPASHRSI
jgi:hypothetical protein